MNPAADAIHRIRSTFQRIESNLDESERLPRPASRSGSYSTSQSILKDTKRPNREIEELLQLLQLEQDRVRSLQTELVQKEHLLQDFNEVDAEMKVNLSTLRQEYQLQEATVEAARSQAQLMQRKAEGAEQALKEMERRVNDFEELVSEYRQENSRFKGLIKQSDEEIRRLTDKKDDLEIEKLKQEIDRLQTENADLKQEIEEINNTAALYQDQISALRLDYQELKQEYLQTDSKEKENKALEQERDQLKAQLAETPSEVEEMKNRIQELELLVSAFRKPEGLYSSVSRSSSVSSFAGNSIEKAAKFDTPSQICESLVSTLGLKNKDEINNTVRRLLRHSEILQKLKELIISTSADSPDSPSLPSSHQVWRWVNRLVSDYVAVQEGLKEAKNMMSAVKSALGVSSTEEVMEEIERRERELERLRRMRK